MGESFEQIFLDFFDQLNIKQEFPELISQRGRWWGTNPNEKREEEIDCVGYSKSRMYFAEVKWTQQAIDLNIVNKLIKKSELLNPQNPYYILFSKSGFTDKVIKQYSKNPSFKLIDFTK